MAENCVTTPWGIERTNAWLGHLLVRHEHLLTAYLAFFYLACLWITLRKFSLKHALDNFVRLWHYRHAAPSQAQSEE
jgi:hypothetical protein